MGALQLSAEAIPLRKRSASWLDFARFRQDFSWVSKDSPARSTCISADPCRFQAQILKIYGLQHTDFNQIHRTIPFDFHQFPCVCTTRSIGRILLRFRRRSLFSVLCALLLRNLDKMDEDVCFIVFESLLTIPKCFYLSVLESLVPQAVLAHKGSNILFPKLRLHIWGSIF